MKAIFLFLAFALFQASAGVVIDGDAFLKSLGTPKKKDTSVDYALSGSDYRTFKPETSPTPDGGLFISVRIDHLRGWLASNDHAILEVTLGQKGGIVSAQSTIAVQGQSIASDVIVGGNDANRELLTPERAVQVGTDLVSNLTAKFLRENIVEAGRVSFPAVLKHNYNQLFQAIRVDGVVVLSATAVPGADVVPPPAPPAPPAVEAAKPAPAAAPEKPKEPEIPAKPNSVPLEIKQY